MSKTEYDISVDLTKYELELLAALVEISIVDEGELAKKKFKKAKLYFKLCEEMEKLASYYEDKD